MNILGNREHEYLRAQRKHPDQKNRRNKKQKSFSRSHTSAYVLAILKRISLSEAANIKCVLRCQCLRPV